MFRNLVDIVYTVSDSITEELWVNDPQVTLDADDVVLFMAKEPIEKIKNGTYSTKQGSVHVKSINDVAEDECMERKVKCHNQTISFLISFRDLQLFEFYHNGNGIILYSIMPLLVNVDICFSRCCSQLTMFSFGMNQKKK